MEAIRRLSGLFVTNSLVAPRRQAEVGPGAEGRLDAFRRYSREIMAGG